MGGVSGGIAAFAGSCEQELSRFVAEPRAMRQRVLRRARFAVQPRPQPVGRNSHPVDRRNGGGTLTHRDHCGVSTSRPSRERSVYQAAVQNIGWMDAWIEVADTIGPLFPAVPEV